MASVWLQEIGDEAPHKIYGRLTETGAISAMAQLLRKFKGFRVQVFDYEWLLYESEAHYKAKKPAASIYVEFCSPPSSPEVGQPMYQAKGKAK